jgi:hypothetical protein
MKVLKLQINCTQMLAPYIEANQISQSTNQMATCELTLIVQILRFK